jgi:hypothetical protein
MDALPALPKFRNRRRMPRAKQKLYLDKILMLQAEGWPKLKIIAWASGEGPDDVPPRPWTCGERNELPLTEKELKEMCVYVDRLRSQLIEQEDRAGQFWQHLARRRDLYAAAFADGEWGTCLDILEDEAKLIGLYPVKSERNPVEEFLARLNVSPESLERLRANLAVGVHASRAESLVNGNGHVNGVSTNGKIPGPGGLCPPSLNGGPHTNGTGHTPKPDDPPLPDDGEVGPFGREDPPGSGGD